MLLWSGQTVAESGSAVAPFALPFLAVTALRATPFDVGVLTALGTVSFLLIALPAGVIVDRAPRRRLMMWCNVGRAVVIGTVPVAYWLGHVTLLQLYVVALATGALTVFFDVAYQSYLPTLLRRDQLVDGNGKIGTTQSMAQMLGLPMAGGMVSLAGAARSVLVDAGSLLVSAVSLALIRTPEPARAARADRPAFRAQLAEGLGFVVGHPVLRKIVACTGTSLFFSSMTTALEMVFLVRYLCVQPGTAGLITACAGLGGAVGGVTGGRLGRLVGTSRIIWLSILGAGWTGLLIPLARPGWGVLLFGLGYFGMYFSAVVYNIAQISYRQAICPPALLGRMNASVRWIAWGTIPLGALAGGSLATWIGVRETLWIAGAGVWAAGLLVFCSPLRGRRDVEIQMCAESPDEHQL
jgi:MFS family permease